MQQLSWVIRIGNIKKIGKFINLLSEKTGIDVCYLILVPLVCIGFNDFPYMIRLTILNIHYAKYAMDFFGLLLLIYVLFSDKKTGDFIFIASLLLIATSIHSALKSEYDSSLYAFVMGFLVLIKYLWGFYLSKNQYNIDHEKITFFNIKSNLVTMGIVIIWTKLSLLFSKYFLDVFLRHYYLSLKQINDYKAIFLFIFIEYKFYVSLFIFLFFMNFILQQRRNNN